MIQRKDTEYPENNEAEVALIRAWDALPTGNYAPSIIQEWLINDMKPAIDKIRNHLTEQGIYGNNFQNSR